MPFETSPAKFSTFRLRHHRARPLAACAPPANRVLDVGRDQRSAARLPGVGDFTPFSACPKTGPRSRRTALVAHCHLLPVDPPWWWPEAREARFTDPTSAMLQASLPRGQLSDIRTATGDGMRPRPVISWRPPRRRRIRAAPALATASRTARHLRTRGQFGRPTSTRTPARSAARRLAGVAAPIFRQRPSAKRPLQAAGAVRASMEDTGSGARRLPFVSGLGRLRRAGVGTREPVAACVSSTGTAHLTW
jgi:hypothetical protein